LGRGSVWYEEIPDCIHQNHIFRVRVDKDILNPEYVSKLIGSDYGKRYFLKSAKQTTGIATINSKQLKEFLVLCPPLDLQNKFATIVTKIEEQKTLVKQAIAESEHLFNSLMSEYFD
jgi:type I restriction enzyme S subunit